MKKAPKSKNICTGIARAELTALEKVTLAGLQARLREAKATIIDPINQDYITFATAVAARLELTLSDLLGMYDITTDAVILKPVQPTKQLE